jgi:hypothetical protein
MNSTSLNTNKKWEGDGGTFPGMNKKGGRYQVFGGEYLYLLGCKYNEFELFVKRAEAVLTKFNNMEVKHAK